MRQLAAFLSVLAFSFACSSGSKQDPARDPAAAPPTPEAVEYASCEAFTKLSALDKYNTINRYHHDSAASFLVDGTRKPLVREVESLRDKARVARERLARVKDQLTASTRLMASTTSFLVPSVSEKTGWQKLSHTLKSRCDFLEAEQQRKPKLVHGLASMAPAHIEFYPELIKIGAKKEMLGRVPNPWTGLLDPKGGEPVRLFIRFSLANPVFGKIPIPRGLLDDPNLKDLKLEFIPGLGMKFLITGQPNYDVVAMESLAGQRSDQNYFKYDFSPDFSKHAPPPFMVRDKLDPEGQADVKSRYRSNPANLGVMALVGIRFEQAMNDAIPVMTPYKDKKADRSGRYGPHPFMLGIDGMVGTKVSGEKIAAFKRPFRLVFEPATGEISDPARRARVVDNTPNKPGVSETDFRTKLAHLEEGDPVYYVTGETEDGRRYRIGKIVLDASPVPSYFQDRVIFVNHEIDTARLHDRLMIEERTRGGGQVDESKFYIVDPEPASR